MVQREGTLHTRTHAHAHTLRMYSDAFTTLSFGPNHTSQPSCLSPFFLYSTRSDSSNYKINNKRIQQHMFYLALSHWRKHADTSVLISTSAEFLTPPNSSPKEGCHLTTHCSGEKTQIQGPKTCKGLHQERKTFPRSTVISPIWRQPAFHHERPKKSKPSQTFHNRKLL